MKNILITLIIWHLLCTVVYYGIYIHVHKRLDFTAIMNIATHFLVDSIIVEWVLISMSIKTYKAKRKQGYVDADTLIRVADEVFDKTSAFCKEHVFMKFSFKD